jgi:capsular exopolysaccharide synthesis family protein
VAEVREDAEEVELRDYLRVLRRRLPIILSVIVVIEAVVLSFSLLAQKEYQAKATLLLQPKSTESLFNPNTGDRTDPVRSLQTEIQVLKSGPVQDAVKAKLGAAPKISASPVGQTDVITVSAISIVPDDAARIANTYAEEYINFRRKQAVDDLFAAGKELQTKVDQLATQLAAPGLSPGAKEALLSQQSLFKERLDQLQVDAALKTGGAQLVTRAKVPTSPVRPTPVRNAILGGIVALIFGVGAAFLRDYLDDTIKTKEDLDRAGSAEVPVIGMIPSVAEWRDGRHSEVLALTNPGAGTAEAYRSLRTSIQFMGLDRDLKIVQITSPSAGEGKTTTIANLGAVLAKAGQRVLVVDCDLRRPRLHEYFGMSNAVGFTSVLLGDAPLQTAIKQVPGAGPLFVLPSGPLPPNPSELLWASRTAQLFNAVRSQFDVCLIDSPPVLPVTDPVVIAKQADVTVLVVAAGVTTRKQLARAVELLRQVNAPLEGIALNRAGEVADYGYAYTYAAGDAPTNGSGRRGRHKKDRARGTARAQQR